MSTVQCPYALYHCNRRFAFWKVMFDLWSAARPWNARLFNSQRTVLLLAQTPVEHWNSWLISINEDLWFFYSILFRVRWLRLLILCWLLTSFFCSFIVSVVSFPDYIAHSGFWLIQNVRNFVNWFPKRWQTTIKPLLKSLSSFDLLIFSQTHNCNQTNHYQHFYSLLLCMKFRHQHVQIILTRCSSSVDSKWLFWENPLIFDSFCKKWKIISYCWQYFLVFAWIFFYERSSAYFVNKLCKKKFCSH